MPDGLVERVRDSVEGLTPGYFALVMASGILSVGMALKHRDLLSLLTLAICGTAFVVLLGLTLWRFVAYRSATNADFLDPRRAFGFFTFVAGTNVLGVRLGMAGHTGTTATSSANGISAIVIFARSGASICQPNSPGVIDTIRRSTFRSQTGAPIAPAAGRAASLRPPCGWMTLKRRRTLPARERCP